MVARRAKSVIRPAGRPRKSAGAPTHRKVTEQTGYAEALNWTRAVAYARSILLRPMTVSVTVQWLHAPSSVPEPNRVTALINVMGIWLRYRTHKPPVWAYARESASRKGVHLHLLVNVPPELIEDFTAAVPRWIEAKADSYKDGAVDVKPIRPGTFDTLQSYFLKDGEDRVHEAFGVLPAHRAKRSGYPVPGKRMRVSHSIDATARKRHPDAPRSPVEATGSPLTSSPLSGQGAAPFAVSGA